MEFRIYEDTPDPGKCRLVLDINADGVTAHIGLGTFLSPAEARNRVKYETTMATVATVTYLKPIPGAVR